MKAELSGRATSRIIADLLSGELDAGLCFSPLRHPDLERHEIERGQMKLVVRKGHPCLRSPARKQLALLSGYPATIHQAAAGVDLCTDHPMFAKFGIAPRVQSVWDSDDIAVGILEKTECWALLPEAVVEAHRFKVVALKPPPGWHAPYTVELLFRGSRGKHAFFGLLKEKLVERAPKPPSK